MAALPVSRLPEPTCPNCGHHGLYGDVCASCGLCQRCDELADDCQCDTPAEERFLVALLEVDGSL
jgi:hypothetical protein